MLKTVFVYLDRQACQNLFLTLFNIVWSTLLILSSSVCGPFVALSTVLFWEYKDAIHGLLGR